MAYKTLLNIGNDKRELLDFNTHYFKMRNTTFCEWCEQNPFGTLDELEIVARNNPYVFRAIGDPFGGTFRISFESTDDDDEFYHWFKTTEAKHGSIEFYDGSDEDYPFKRIEFWDAWISDISESFSSVGSSPMTLHCCISPATVRINKSLVFQKNWWITDINQKEEKEEEKAELFVSEIKWRGKKGNYISSVYRKDIMLNHEIELEVLTKDFYNGESFELTVKQSKGRRIKGSSSEFTVKGTAKEDGTALIPVKVECDFKDDNQDFEDIIFYHKDREVARFKENFGWTYVKEGGMTKIFVNVELNSTYLPAGCTLTDYCLSINQQFKRTLELSSNGEVTGKVFFTGTYTIELPQRTVSLTFDQKGVKNDPNQKVIEGFALGGFIKVGSETNDTPDQLTDIMETSIHELLHTVRLDHPFEITQAKDTQLFYEKDYKFTTAIQTDPNIYYNIMNYNYIYINGKRLEDLWKIKRPEYITKGQLAYMLKEIQAQMNSAGTALFSGNASFYFDAEFYPEIGTPVTSKN